MERAGRFLASAQLLLDDGDTASSVSRSYYAMFLAAEAALLSRDIAASSHRGVIAAFGELFVKTGIFDKREGRSLARAHEQRLAADYDAATLVPVGEARELIETARGFVARIERWLAKE
jgi:uncharacterized protein (UPF0332 family)